MSSELRQEPDEPSDALDSAKREGTARRTHAAGVRVIRQISTFRSSMLPDPEILRAYSQLIPDGPERIMGLIEREATHRHARITRGLWMAYTLTLSLGAGGVFLGATGHDWLAAAVFTTTIGAVATAFIVGRWDRSGSKQ
jgi:uncharacterized membrane protein